MSVADILPKVGLTKCVVWSGDQLPGWDLLHPGSHRHHHGLAAEGRPTLRFCSTYACNLLVLWQYFQFSECGHKEATARGHLENDLWLQSDDWGSFAKGWGWLQCNQGSSQAITCRMTTWALLKAWAGMPCDKRPLQANNDEPCHQMHCIVKHGTHVIHGRIPACSFSHPFSACCSMVSCCRSCVLSTSTTSTCFSSWVHFKRIACTCNLSKAC